MHKSRMAVMVIDCNTGAPDAKSRDAAAGFWGEALGRPADAEASKVDQTYTVLGGPDAEMRVLVQMVDHPSRMHLDIETDDIEAEACRLEALGAKRVSPIKTWLVMEAPTGHRFCLVKPQRPDFDENANVWP